jgi:hypothetical protein
MRLAFAWVVVGFASWATGCGGHVPADDPGPVCSAAVLTNCPQDTIPDSGECPLPPIVGTQGFYTVGCRVAASCNYGMQNCACVQGASGPGWSCE